MVNKPITYAYLETTNYCNLECSFCNREIEPSNKSNYCNKSCEHNDNYDKEHHRNLKEKKKNIFKFWKN